MRAPKTSVAHPRPPLSDERIDGPARGVRAKSAGLKLLSAIGVAFLAVSPHCAEWVRREAWPRPPAGGGSVHASLDPRVGIKLIRPPQHFLPALNGSATVSRVQEVRTAGSPPVHIVAAA